MPRECEAKIKVEKLTTVETILLEVGAAKEGEHLEKNWVLDDPSHSLKAKGILLRVRSVGGPGGILTVKLPIEGGEFKNREEIESMVDCTDDLLLQLRAIGYDVVWRYEKCRQTWLWNECVLALDELPELGAFVEIEGTPERIREACAGLRLDPAAHIGDTYWGLWTKYLAARGEAMRDMVFETPDCI